MIINILAISISAISVIAALWASNTSSEKLRLDLYNRRFNIYSNVLTYVLLFISKSKYLDSKENQKIQEKFILAFRESQFLFRNDVYKIISEINQLTATIRSYYDQENKVQRDYEKHEKNISNELALYDKISALEKAMKEYLKFNLLNWYHFNFNKHCR